MDYAIMKKEVEIKRRVSRKDKDRRCVIQKAWRWKETKKMAKIKKIKRNEK